MDREKVQQILFGSGSAEPLIPVWHQLDDLLTDHELERYAKTVSVSYTTPTNHVVAAVHLHTQQSSLKVALAVPPETESDRLEDMSVLRWRTMPRGITLTSPDDIDDEVRRLVQLAINTTENTAVSNDFYVSDRDRRIRARIRERWDGDKTSRV